MLAELEWEDFGEEIGCWRPRRAGFQSLAIQRQIGRWTSNERGAECTYHVAWGLHGDLLLVLDGHVGSAGQPAIIFKRRWADSQERLLTRKKKKKPHPWIQFKKHSMSPWHRNSRVTLMGSLDAS